VLNIDGTRLRGRLRRSWQRLRSLPTSTRILLATCVAISTVIVWGFRYPPGVDLPGHAQLFGTLANYHDPVLGVSGFYDLQLVTPYLLTYLLGAGLAKVTSGLFATKCILLLIALATPYVMFRWLSAVGGEKAFAFWGFALAFGYPFVWGFISFGLSLPLGFLCLEAWARAPTGSAVRRAAVLGGLLVALFFTHAITFALVAVCAGLLTLGSPRVAFWRRSAALAVAFCVSMAWYLGRQSGGGLNPHEAPGMDRLALLFGGEFHMFESYPAALAGLSMLAVLALALRPTFSTRAERWLPLVLSLLAFCSVPNFLMNTAYVGHRFVFFVHAFAPAAFRPRQSEDARGWAAPVSGLLTVVFLLVCLVRTVGFNQEMQGFAEMSAKVPVGIGVRKGVGDRADDSEWFGRSQLTNAFAWVMAERGGMGHNDPAHYFQLPILHAQDVPFPTHFRYILARDPGAKGYIKSKKIKAKEIARSGAWSLWEDGSAPPFELPYGTVLRYGQDRGLLRVDRTPAKKPLVVAGTRYRRGLGTQARSIIQLRPRATGRLRGACGLDDAGRGRTAVVCTILDHRERVLHRAVAKPGAAPVAFDVPVHAGWTVYFKATLAEAVDPTKAGALVDWVQLEVR
jgi:hypothetical protein